jgi:hypothetical protein
VAGWGCAVKSERGKLKYPQDRKYQFSLNLRQTLYRGNPHPVPVQRTERDFQYYAAKDLAMSEEADYGFMLANY